MSLGVSKNEIDQIYNKKLEKFKLVDLYLSRNNPSLDPR